MRRTVILILALVLLLAACTGEQPINDGTSISDTTPAIPSEPVPQTDAPTEPIEDKETNVMTITVSGQIFRATLYDNDTAAALREMLPMTLDMQELNGNEKYDYLSASLPTDAISPGQIQTGDIMLYGSNCLVLFYESFSTGYSYTPVGRVDDPAGLASAVGRGGVQVTFSLGG